MTTEEKKSQTAERVYEEVHQLRNEIEVLKKREAYYRCLFENAPVALLEEDCSGVKVFIDDLRSKGVQDFETYFEEHPKAVIKCYESIAEEITINKEFLSLYKAKSKGQLLSELETVVFTEHSYRAFKKLFVALANGKMCFSTETTDSALDGSPIHAMVTWTIAVGYEDTWARILVSVIPFQKMRLDNA